MGYRINYPPGNGRKRPGSSLVRIVALTFVFLLLFFQLVGVYWPEGKTVLQTMASFIRDILPAYELEALAADLAQGEGIQTVFLEFGRQVLGKGNHAGN